MMVKPAAEQLEFFRTELGRTQPKLVMQEFESALKRANLNVMWGALHAARGVVQSTKRPAANPIGAVFAQYQRITASIAQLFPVFFVFESTWRSFVSTALVMIYGDDRWWHGVRDAVAGGSDPLAVPTLGRLPARHVVVKEVAYILQGIPLPSGLETTADLLEEAPLVSLENLIVQHWGQVSSVFVATAALGVPEAAVFRSHFRRVRRGRNDAYHHRIVEDWARVVESAEQLVDLLSVHLGTRVREIVDAKLPPLQFHVFRETRHG